MDKVQSRNEDFRESFRQVSAAAFREFARSLFTLSRYSFAVNASFRLFYARSHARDQTNFLIRLEVENARGDRESETVKGKKERTKHF